MKEQSGECPRQRGSGLTGVRKETREAREFPGAMAVQWLGLAALTARVQFQSLAGELRCRKALPQKKKKKLEGQGTEKKSMGHEVRRRADWSESSLGKLK